MRLAYSNILEGRDLYHATPLHYLPCILESGELRSQRLIGYSMGRVTARRRDRILQLDRYVHCSPAAETPMLKHKLALGYPHIVLEFTSCGIEDNDISILPCSTKAWRSKWQCQPAADLVEARHILLCYDKRTRFRGMEVLLSEKLSLQYLKSIIVYSDQEGLLVERLIAKLGSVAHIIVQRRKAPGSVGDCSERLPIIADYFELCSITGIAQRPPNLPFD